MTAVALPVSVPTGADHMIVTAELPLLSPTQAFAACTTPELITQWWPQEAEIEPKLGGHYRLRWPSMNWELFGQFTEFEPGERLGYTWNWAHQPDLSTRIVTIDFEPLATGSKVIVQHGIYGDSAVEQEDRQGHIDGWVYFLGRLQELNPALT